MVFCIGQILDLVQDRNPSNTPRHFHIESMQQIKLMDIVLVKVQSAGHYPEEPQLCWQQTCWQQNLVLIFLITHTRMSAASSRAANSVLSDYLPHPTHFESGDITK